MNQVADYLDQIADDLQSVKLDNVGVMASDFIRNHIYKGKNFAPLSPATVAYRGKGKPLQDSTALTESITHKVSRNTVTVGTNKPYARLQNNGGTITAKKKPWLWIPAAGTRQLQRKYGYKISEVLDGLRSSGCSVFRIGRTICYKKAKGSKPKIIYYLKKQVVIPKREFFYITDKEAGQLLEEITSEIL